VGGLFLAFPATFPMGLVMIERLENRAVGPASLGHRERRAGVAEATGARLAAIGLTAFASYWTLAAANRVRGYLGETGIRVLTRLMGLLLTAIAVQFILNGLADVSIVRPSK